MSMYFLMWNLIGSLIIFKHIADREERRIEKEKEIRRNIKLENRYLKERIELRELLLGLSINESQVVRELMRNSKPHRLVYDNYMLGIYMFEIYDYDTCESFYVIYDSKHKCWYYNWHAYTSNDDSNIIRIVEYHRNLREKKF